MYFVISQFDTDANVDVYLDKQKLLVDMMEWVENGDEFVSHIDELENGNPAEWGMKRLIIKGNIVVPKPKKIVETFEID